MKKIKIAICVSFFILGIFGLAGSSWAANWYVDNVAAGLNNGTSWTNAWKSFSAISWSSIKPGDTLYISGGSSSKTYAESMSIPALYGTSGSRITITKGVDSGHNGTVIIKPSSGTPIYSRSGIKYITLSNLTITGCPKNIDIWKSTGVTLDHITMPNEPGQGFYLAFNDSMTVTNCKYVSQSYSSNTTDGIAIWESNNITITHNYVEVNNTNTSTHDDCLQHGLDNDSYSPPTSYIGNGTIAYNIFKNTATDTENSQVIHGEHMRGTWNIYNNVLDGGKYACRNFNIPITRNGAVINFFNNTVISGENITGSLVRCTVDSGTVKFNMKNNIIYTTSPSSSFSLITLSASGLNVTSDHNLVYGPGSSNWVSSHPSDTRGVPSLDSSYKPAAGGLAIGAGTVLSLFSDDLARVTRGTSWDIGAYEHGSTESAPLVNITPPAAPTGLKVN